MWSTHSLVLYSWPELVIIFKRCQYFYFCLNCPLESFKWSPVILQLFITFFLSILQYGDSVRDVWVGVTHSAQHHQQDDHQWRTHGKRKTTSFTLTIPSDIRTGTFIYLCVVCQASLDQPTQTVVMHRTEPTSLQNMALQLAEKLGGLMENNERVFDLKQGVYGGYFNRGTWYARFRKNKTWLKITFIYRSFYMLK